MFEGEFADVWFKPNSHMNQNTRQMWVDSAMRRPIVTSVLTNLAANGIAREILAGFASNGDAFDQDRFMIEFLARWLERDTASDGRPSRIKRIHLESYLQLLEQVALKYASEERIDSQGYFDVHPSDGVMIEDHGEMLAVPVCQILDRSRARDGRSPTTDVTTFSVRAFLVPSLVGRHAPAAGYRARRNLTCYKAGRLITRVAAISVGTLCRTEFIPSRPLQFNGMNSVLRAYGTEGAVTGHPRDHCNRNCA